jgi:hypothetical protein
MSLLQARRRLSCNCCALDTTTFNARTAEANTRNTRTARLHARPKGDNFFLYGHRQFW